jgi:sugar lactone lactonase YvrE
VAFDPKGQALFLADLENRRVRAVDLRSGTVSLIAGNGKSAVPVDGSLARESPLVDPRAVAADAEGNVWILERGGHALRVVDKSGKVFTVAGTGKPGSAGDGGPAQVAQLNGPKHLCIDGRGDVIIADTENHLIRKYLVKEKRIVRVAGTGAKGSSGVGQDPLAVELNQPHGVCWHSARGLYVVDTGNDRVLLIQRDTDGQP